MTEQLDLLGEPMMRRSASFARSGVRKRLSRDWSAGWNSGPRALVIGCNPPTADAEQDDPTSRWWNAWFQLFGFGGYDAVNLYPFCTSSPVECRRRVDRLFAGLDWGDRDDLFANVDYITTLAKDADQDFVCWGAIAWDQDWIEHVVEHIQSGSAPFPAMARGKHRIPPDQKPILWRAA